MPTNVDEVDDKIHTFLMSVEAHVCFSTIEEAIQHASGEQKPIKYFVARTIHNGAINNYIGGPLVQDKIIDSFELKQYRETRGSAKYSK